MYRRKKLRLFPPPQEEEDENSSSFYDIGEFVDHVGATFSSHSAPATHTNPDASTVLVAFKSDQPVLRVQRPGAGRGVERLHSHEGMGWGFLDVCAFGGRLYAATTDGRLAEVELAGGGAGAGVRLLETLGYEEGEGREKTVHHIFDVFTEGNSHVLKVVAGHCGIKKVTVW